MSIYERIMSGETLQVKFKNPVEGLHQGAFKVGPLWLIGDMYVTDKSEWKRWAEVGGITINERKRHTMQPGEMQAWCSGLELVS
jgi:hypothetical protein